MDKLWENKMARDLPTDKIHRQWPDLTQLLYGNWG